MKCRAWSMAIGLLWLSHFAWAQNAVLQDADSEESRQFFERIVVTATATEREVFDTPNAVTVVTEEEVRQQSPLSVVDALAERPGMWVEKRTTTASDPVMRGLSGGNLLALVDGNTLSTFWGEGGYAGDDMYGKIDAEAVERIEVIRGPQSVLYGSNALGGVLNFFTRSCPLPFPEEGSRWGMRFKPVVGSAAEEWRGRAEVHGATPRFRFLLGGSMRDVGDVRRGGGGDQVPTSGEGRNWDLKGEWRASERGTLTFTLLDLKNERVHRYYRPLEYNDNDREAAGLAYAVQDVSALWRLLEFRLYYQDKEDQRVYTTKDYYGIARTRTYTGDIKAVHEPGAGHRLTFGLQYHRDDGESAGDEQFTLHYSDGRIRKAAPDTRWASLGAYAQDEWEIGGRWSLIGSLRLDRLTFESTPDEYYVPAGAWDPSRDAVDVGKTAWVGGVGIVYHWTEGINLIANCSRGFRLWAPEFGVTQRAYGVVVPSGLLDPVTSDNLDLGFRARGGQWGLSVAVYYSLFHHWQVIVPSTFDGSDWYDYDQDGIHDGNETVYQTRDIGDAYVYGVEAEGEWSPAAQFPALKNWRVGGGFAWNFGNDQTSGQPIRHTQPAEILLHVAWSKPDARFKPYVRLGMMAVGRYDRIPADRLMNDPGYRSDPQDMTSPLLRPYGLPGYTVFNLRSGIELGEGKTLHLNIENLSDKLYRRAHSRWDEAGFNVILALDYSL